MSDVPKPGMPVAKKPSDRLRSHLEQSAQLSKILDQLPVPAADSAPRLRYDISTADGRKLTACPEGNEREYLQWLLTSTFRAIATNGQQGAEGVALLDTIHAVLLNSKPTSPLEALITTQMLASHEMAMRFSERALRASDSEMSCRLANQAARFMETACRQAETIQKLRGGSQQKVEVKHVHVSDGGQAIIGSVGRGEHSQE